MGDPIAAAARAMRDEWSAAGEPNIPCEAVGFDDLARAALRGSLGAYWDTHVYDQRGVVWSMAHSVACRGDILSCPLHEAALRYTSPPVATGRYIVELDAAGTGLVFGELLEAR